MSSYLSACVDIQEARTDSNTFIAFRLTTCPVMLRDHQVEGSHEQSCCAHNTPLTISHFLKSDTRPNSKLALIAVLDEQSKVNLALQQVEDALGPQQDLIDEAEQGHPDYGRDVNAPHRLNQLPRRPQKRLGWLHHHRPWQLVARYLQPNGSNCKILTLSIPMKQ